MDSPSPSRIAFTGLAALAVAMGIGRFAFTPVLPMMQGEGLLTLAQGGWLASANYVGYLAGALLAMFVRVEPSRAIRVALVVIAATTFAMGFQEHMPGWLANRFIAGVASACVLVFAAAWAMEQLAALSRPALGGVVFAGVGAGIAIAGLACLVVMQQASGSVAAWITLGTLAVALTALAWRPLSSPGFAAPAPAEPFRFGGKGFLRLVLCYGAFGLGYIVPATFLPAMARDAIPDPTVFGWTWPIFGAAAALSTLAAAAVARKIGHRTLWIVAALVMAVGVALPIFDTGVVALLVSALFVGGTFMVISMAGLQEARRVAGAHSREVIAAMTCAFALGQIVGPLAVSLLAQGGFGYSAALAAATAVLILSALFLLPRRKP